jgi:pyridoxine 5-phosphate synthase
MTKLSVNVNKIALLRNSRAVGIPNLARLARIALEAGAHGITVHPRPDRRHILPEDVMELNALIAAHPGVEYNVEGNPFYQVMELVASVLPDQCTLVPDEPKAFTSDHGWDLRQDGERLRPIVAQLKRLGVRVSLFMDPIPENMIRAKEVGADRVELYTEPYARAFSTSDEAAALERYAAAARAAREAGLGINAGHDLNRENLTAFLRAVPDVLEVSIGHALVSDALEFGMAKSVSLYLDAIARGSAQ